MVFVSDDVACVDIAWLSLLILSLRRFTPELLLRFNSFGVSGFSLLSEWPAASTFASRWGESGLEWLEGEDVPDVTIKDEDEDVRLCEILLVAANVPEEVRERVGPSSESAEPNSQPEMKR